MQIRFRVVRLRPRKVRKESARDPVKGQRHVAGHLEGVAAELEHELHSKQRSPALFVARGVAESLQRSEVQSNWPRPARVLRGKVDILRRVRISVATYVSIGLQFQRT